MDIILNIYIVVSIIVIIFQYWYIRRLKYVMNFMVETLQRYARAFINDDMNEVERIDNDVKNFK